MRYKIKEERRGRPKTQPGTNPYEELKKKSSAKPSTPSTNKTKLLRFECIQALIKYLEDNIENNFTILEIEYESASNHYPFGRFILTIAFISGIKIYLMWEDLDEVKWALHKTGIRNDAWALDLEFMISKIDNLEKQLRDIEDIRLHTRKWLSSVV